MSNISKAINTKEVVIILDDGHGESTAGKRTPPLPNGRQIKEWEFNSEVTLEIGRQLKARGYNVEYTKNILSMQEDVPINTRVAVANKYYDLYKSKGYSHNNIVFISSHYNANDGVWDSCKGGTETLYYKNGDEETIRLAKCLQGCVVNQIGRIDRGIKGRDDIGVLTSTKMRASLIEYGFMDVKAEALKMLDKQFIKGCATGVIEGIEKYFNLETVDVAEEVVNVTQGVSDWAKSSWLWCHDMGFMDGNRPKDMPTREELACVLQRLYEEMYATAK